MNLTIPIDKNSTARIEFITKNKEFLVIANNYEVAVFEHTPKGKIWIYYSGEPRPDIKYEDINLAGVFEQYNKPRKKIMRFV